MRNMFSKLNISKQLVSKGASLVVVLVALVAAYVAVSMNSTLGWFAKNNTVTASGMITQAYDARFKVTYTNVKLTENEDGTIGKVELIFKDGRHLHIEHSDLIEETMNSYITD